MAQIRRATHRDAHDIGRVQVQAWKQGSRGIMPDGFLDGLDIGERSEQWAHELIHLRDDQSMLVAVELLDVVGFAGVGPEAGDDGSTATGEVYVLNVDPWKWGKGVGRALLAAAEEELRRLGHPRAVLWMAPGNDRARRLCEAAGWQPDGTERKAEVLGVTVAEVRYAKALAPDA